MSRAPRRVALDVARGGAVLGMAYVHLVPAESDRLARLLEGKAAATFCVLAGMAWAIQSERVTDHAAFRRYLLRRATSLAALGIGLHLWLWPTEVLTPLALMLLATMALRRWPLPAAALVLLATPLLTTRFAPLLAADWLEDGSHRADHVLGWATLRFYLLDGNYPLLPWLAFPLLGVAAVRHAAPPPGAMPPRVLPPPSRSTSPRRFARKLAAPTPSGSFVPHGEGGEDQHVAHFPLRQRSEARTERSAGGGTAASLRARRGGGETLRGTGGVLFSLACLLAVGLQLAVGRTALRFTWVPTSLPFFFLAGSAAFAWILGLTLWEQRSALPKLLMPLALLGRASLTHYVLHLVVLFIPLRHYYPDEGWPWRVGIAAFLGYVALALPLTALWFRRFERGPIESLWVSLSGPNVTRG